MSIDYGVERLIAREGLGMPLVHAEADFKRPMRMGEPLDIAVVVERLTEGSIAFRYTLSGTDGVVRATALLVHAFVKLDGFESTTAPPGLLAGLRERGVLGDAVE